jgi:hypothetical protein
VSLGAYIDAIASASLTQFRASGLSAGAHRGLVEQERRGSWRKPHAAKKDPCSATI